MFTLTSVVIKICCKKVQKTSMKQSVISASAPSVTEAGLYKLGKFCCQLIYDLFPEMIHSYINTLWFLCFPGGDHGGAGTEVSGSQQDCLLHHGGGGGREAPDWPGRGVQTNVSASYYILQQKITRRFSNLPPPFKTLLDLCWRKFTPTKVFFHEAKLMNSLKIPMFSPPYSDVLCSPCNICTGYFKVQMFLLMPLIQEPFHEESMRKLKAHEWKRGLEEDKGRVMGVCGGEGGVAPENTSYMCWWTCDRCLHLLTACVWLRENSDFMLIKSLLRSGPKWDFYC